MCPIVHGRIYPEIESSSLVYRELRVLIDPRAVTPETTSHLLDLDVLRTYVQGLPGPPCRISLLVPAQRENEFIAEYELIRRLGGEVLPFASILLPEAVKALGATGERYPDLGGLASTALGGDADIVVTVPLPGDVNHEQISQKLHVSFEGWAMAKKSCEVFVRGHEVPWSFRCPAWGYPWTPFYSVAEPDLQLQELHYRAAGAGLNPETLEDLRSLAYNRHANLCYARDKLLFYVQQRRTAKRKKLTRQNFHFEAGHYLNHYYVLLWAGLDQACWIVNDIFELGLTKKDWRKVGALNSKFLNVLRESAPLILEIYENPDFVRWAKMLRSARHYVAHKGIAMPASLFVRPETEPTDEELDREIERSDEWRTVESILPCEVLEASRPGLRFEARLRRYQEIQEPVFQIEIEGEEYFIFPLKNTEWDFGNFFDFVHKIVTVALQTLHEREKNRVMRGSAHGA